MKKFLLSYCLLFSLFTQLAVAQSMNEYGHLIFEPDAETQSFQRLNDHELLSSHKTKMIGNGFWKLKDTNLTVDAVGHDGSCDLRIYDSRGSLINVQRYPKITSMQIANDEKSFAFHDGKELVHIDMNGNVKDRFASSRLFTFLETGSLCYWNENQIVFANHNNPINCPERPGILEATEQELIVGYKDQIVLFNLSEPNVVEVPLEGALFDLTLASGVMHWTEKLESSKGFQFLHKKLDETRRPLLIQERQLELQSRTVKSDPQMRDGNPILSPLDINSESAPLPIGNSYGAIQNYGGEPYLHPGVDFMGPIGAPVYAVQSGYVKSILTISADLHWRIAIGIEDIAEEQEGYLYAHLVETSIPYVEGDYVEKGAYLGELVAWPTSDFHHCHFARIKASGQYWDGQWWTTGDVLSDVTNFEDDSSPAFELLNNGHWADFYSIEDAYFIQPDSLYGSLRLVCSAYDYSNTDWRLDIKKLEYKIAAVEAPETIIYQMPGTSYNFPIDTYLTETPYTNQVRDIIYSMNFPYFSEANYSVRNYFQNVSATDGVDGITEDDLEATFDTTQFPDGDYLLFITAEDAAANATTVQVLIKIRNNPEIPTSIAASARQSLSIFPNPTSDRFFLQSNGEAQKMQCVVFNTAGQELERFELNSSGYLHAESLWNPGHYIMQVRDANGKVLEVFELVKL